MTLAKQEPQEERSLGITKASLAATALQLELLEGFVKTVLRKDEDYGVIPGTSGKSTLLKPGAANVISAYNCHPQPHIEQETIDLDRGLVFYRARVDITHNATSRIMASGFGSCSSYEAKYRYRASERKCPACGKPAIIKGREEYGGGWLCFGKKGGCGAKFDSGDATIESQPVGRQVNEDPMEQANTILKMAVKRAEVDAALRLPGVARFFTQDLDDMAPSADSLEQAQAVPQRPAPAPARPQQRPPVVEGQARPTNVEPDFAKFFKAAKDRGLKPEVALKLLGSKDWQDWVGMGGTLDQALKKLHAPETEGQS